MRDQRQVIQRYGQAAPPSPRGDTMRKEPAQHCRFSLPTFCKHLTLSQYVFQGYLFSLSPCQTFPLLPSPFSPLVPATHFDPHPVFSSVSLRAFRAANVSGSPFSPSWSPNSEHVLAAASPSTSASPHSSTSQPNRLAGGSSPLRERTRNLCVLT